jgi:MFS family permease
LIITFFFLEIQTPKTPLVARLRAIDWLGFVAVVGGTVMFLLGLEYGGISYPWDSPTVLCLLIFGIIMLGIFVVIERKVSRYPIMPLWLFKQGTTVATYGTALAQAGVYIAGSYYLPLYFQVVLGASPVASGLYLLPLVLSLMVSQLLSSWYVKKSGQCVYPVWFVTTVLVIAQGLFIAFC